MKADKGRAEDLLSILKIAGIDNNVIADLPDSYKDFKLTYAEKVLIYEGSSLGIANCRIPTNVRVNKFFKVKNHLFIRSEILEWLFFPSRIEKIFKKGKLIIIGAIIDRNIELYNLHEPQGFPFKRKHEETYSLDLAYTNIKIDIVFESCTFYGGIGLTNSSTKDFILRMCRVGYSLHKDNFGYNKKNSIKADNLVTNGDLKISDIHDEQRQNTYGLSSFNTNTDITHDIFLLSATITELLSFSFSEIKGDIIMRELTTKQLFLNGVTALGKIDLDLSTIKDVLWADGGKFLGGGDYYKSILNEDYYSFSARGSVLGWLSFKNGVEILNGIDLSLVKVNNIIFDSVFVSKNIKTDIAIDLRRCEISGDLYLRNGSLISGRVALLDSKIARNLDFSHSRFIGSIEPNTPALNCDNITIGGRIAFTHDKIKTNSFYYDIVEDIRNSYNRYKITDPNYFKGKSDIFFRLFKNIREEYAIELKNIKKLVDEGKVDKSILIERFNQMSKEINNIEQRLYVKPLEDFKISYKILKEEIEKEFNGKVSEKHMTEMLVETSIVIGEASFSGLKCAGQFDCSNSLFIGMNSDLSIYQPKSNEINVITTFFKNLGINIPRNKEIEKINTFPNALTIKYAKIDGDLFLNEGPTENPIPFRAIGEVNLHSSRINQFFVSPRRGESEYTKWKLNGLKYDYIYSKNVNDKTKNTYNLENCAWFYDYSEENNRQPYEQLATIYLKSGEDSKARDILLGAYPKNIPEGFMLAILKLVSKIGVPHYKALRNLITVILIGWLVFYNASITGGIIATSKIGCVSEDSLTKDKVLFSPLLYSVQTVFPLVNTEQRNLFSPKYISNKNIFPEQNLFYIDSGLFASFYLFLHSFLGVILITMFVIGITRIIRRA